MKRKIHRLKKNNKYLNIVRVKKFTYRQSKRNATSNRIYSTQCDCTRAHVHK